MRWVAVAAILGPGCSRGGEKDGPGQVRDIAIAQPEGWWAANGFVQMVPPAHLPTSTPDADQVEIWIRIPDGEPITVAGGDGSTDITRHRLQFPPGTRADRVEFADVDGRRLVVDVRGTTLEPKGVQRFHVLRRDGFGPDSKLFGVSWRRGDGAAHGAAVKRLGARVAATRQARAMPADRREGFLRDLEHKNDCLRCHGLGTPDAPHDGDRIVNRGTDASGFYTPTTVLRDTVALEPYGAADRNRDDPYVSRIACDSGPATWTGRGGRATCADGSVPRATRDVAAGLAAGDPYTGALCASRRVLAERLEPELGTVLVDDSCGQG